MPKLFAICRMSGGLPDIDVTVTPVKGWVLCDQVGNQGAYLFSGTAAQLAALNALSQVLGIIAVTQNGARWAELDGVISSAVRTKLNTWLTARGYPNIPADWTYRQVILAVYKRLNNHFDLSNFDIEE
jgi:hypothetical protein